MSYAHMAALGPFTSYKQLLVTEVRYDLLEDQPCQYV